MIATTAIRSVIRVQPCISAAEIRAATILDAHTAITRIASIV